MNTGECFGTMLDSLEAGFWDVEERGSMAEETDIYVTQENSDNGECKPYTITTEYCFCSVVELL